ncbi:hypothetical protein MWN34_04840 [Ancylobacter sp. 6x-1]|uniref:Uncharacterized protein n=1 Tax=Ancylobacter crimeensis TaxID=2579147 RepID=A0ABT0D8I7_9HYPH|nr:hypothetical protein [Ancylobacter crimeensis]MCK0196234.1 hypothetical protein [Ancylobacter crimeensis]
MTGEADSPGTGAPDNDAPRLFAADPARAARKWWRALWMLVGAAVVLTLALWLMSSTTPG